MHIDDLKLILSRHTTTNGMGHLVPEIKNAILPAMENAENLIDDYNRNVHALTMQLLDNLRLQSKDGLEIGKAVYDTAVKCGDSDISEKFFDTSNILDNLERVHKQVEKRITDGSKHVSMDIDYELNRVSNAIDNAEVIRNIDTFDAVEFQLRPFADIIADFRKIKKERRDYFAERASSDERIYVPQDFDIMIQYTDQEEPARWGAVTSHSKINKDTNLRKSVYKAFAQARKSNRVPYKVFIKGVVNECQKSNPKATEYERGRFYVEIFHNEDLEEEHQGLMSLKAL